MSRTRKPTVAAVERVIKAHEKGALNPIEGWLAAAPNGNAREVLQELSDISQSLHYALRLLREDVAQGLVDWEGDDAS